MLYDNKDYRFDTPMSSFLNQFIILQQLPEGGVIVLNTVPSTNQYLIDNILYIKSGDAVVTENQTHGRGKPGKIWITPKGQSICLSMYWKLYQQLPTVMQLNVTVSCIVATVLRNFGVSHIKIKRPNDLYVYNKKIAGILIEIITQNAYISHVIIGIGINISICVSTKLKIKISKNWIDLNHIGIFPNRNTLVIILIKKLREMLNQLKFNNY